MEARTEDAGQAGVAPPRYVSEISLGARERLFSRVVRDVAWRAAFLLGAAALAACDTPRPAQPALWTLFDVAALYADGASDQDVIATDAGLPQGVALGTMLNKTDPPTLAVQKGLAEAYLVAYTTTEVWTHFDEIWAQPVYIPVTGWSGGPMEPSQQPIFSVGADSLFYSPFWRMIYVEVPDGVAKSTREILDGKYPLHPSRGWVAPLAPPGVGLGDMQPTAGGAVMGTGWLDGAPAPFVKFPATPVGIGDDEIIDEVPIFHFVFVNDDGDWVAPAIPAVLGTGPLGAHIPGPKDDLELPTAKYSGYWRVYNVVVPATARVFAPPDSAPDKVLKDAHVTAVSNMYGTEVTDPANAGMIATLLGRVAMNEACFASLAKSLPINGSCKYLDSQDAIEANIDKAAIVRTDVTVTCPIVSIEGMPVKP